MSEFSLDEEKNIDPGHFQSRAIFGQEETPRMVGWVMKMGVKDEKRAGHVLLGIVILCILFTIIIILFNLTLTPKKGDPLPTLVERLPEDVKENMPEEVKRGLQDARPPHLRNK